VQSLETPRQVRPVVGPVTAMLKAEPPLVETWMLPLDKRAR
jgi:hypothetical protein